MRDPEKVKAWVLQLEREYDHACFAYRSKMRRPVIRLHEEQARWGHWNATTRTLTLSFRLIENYSWAVVVEILKHEMAHQWVSDKDDSDEAHGPFFRAACERFGVAAWAQRATLDPKVPIEPWKIGAPDTESARLQARVEKLLALANSANPHEAAAAMQKVQELYARYNLSLVGSSHSPDFLSREIPTGKKRIERHHFLIASLLNDHFFVRVIHGSRYDTERCAELKMIEVLGSRANVEMAEYVYHFLWNQIHLRWKLYRESTGCAARGKSSFFLGLLTEFRKKLEQGEQASSSLALAIVEDPRLTEFVRERYPRLVSFARGRGLRDKESFHAGQAEGRRLTLHRPVGTSQGFLGRLLSR